MGQNIFVQVVLVLPSRGFDILTRFGEKLNTIAISKGQQTYKVSGRELYTSAFINIFYMYIATATHLIKLTLLMFLTI